MNNNNTNLRLYAFCNFYLNSISQGIQTAHVVGEMAKAYRGEDTKSSKLFWEWLEDGKTIIVLNGGMGGDVLDSYYEHSTELLEEGIPTGIFYEESRAFGTAGSQAPTCWACVLPEEVYTAKKIVIGVETFYGFANESNTSVYAQNPPLSKFLDYKNSCGLAR